jgi:hypothetical protein
MNLYIYRSSIRSILILILVIGGSYTFADDKGGKGGWTSLQSAEMIDFGSGMPVAGGGILLRSKNEVEARLSTMGLEPWAAYTVWWVIFNKPSKCSAPGCGGDDIFIDGNGPPLNRPGVEKAEISVIYANGFVTGGDGVANVTAHLNADKVPAGWGVNFGWKDGKKSGLKKGNGNKAELHMVVRSHSDAIEGEVGFQTSNFDGVCMVCEDQQAIIFNPL